MRYSSLEILLEMSNFKENPRKCQRNSAVKISLISFGNLRWKQKSSFYSTGPRCEVGRWKIL